MGWPMIVVLVVSTGATVGLRAAASLPHAGCSTAAMMTAAMSVRLGSMTDPPTSSGNRAGRARTTPALPSSLMSHLPGTPGNSALGTAARNYPRLSRLWKASDVPVGGGFYMLTILLIVLVIVVLGGGGGYYGYNRYGNSGLGGALGLVIVVLLLLWLLGVFHGGAVAPA